MSIQTDRINAAIDEVFAAHPETAQACGAGAWAGFRFLADFVLGKPGIGTDESPQVYDELFARVAMAKANLMTGDPDAQKYRQVALDSFKLGAECGRNTHAILRHVEKEKADLDKQQRDTIKNAWTTAPTLPTATAPLKV